MSEKITEILQSPNGEALNYFAEGETEFLKSQSEEKFPVEENIIRFLGDSQLTGNNGRYQKLYDRFSSFYDTVTKFFAWLKDGSEKNRVMQYLSYLNIKDNDRVIEISIGTGRNIKYLNSHSEYYGVDISLGMLKRCSRNMKKLNREITLVQAEAENLPVKDSTFDVVFSAGGFNFFNDPGKAVNEMLRIAKSGAQLLIYDETEKFRLKHSKNKFYKGIKIKNPMEYLPDSCMEIQYDEICKGDLYVLSFKKQ